MSEPYSAFARLRITRPNLLTWLDAPPSNPTRWTDWRTIGGLWYRPNGVEDFAHATDADMAETSRDAWQRLARWPSVRDALRELIRGGDSEAFAARRFVYDAVTHEFEGGSLFFDEGLISFVAFLALVRGSEDHLGPDEAGVAVIHDYTFVPSADDATAAALSLGPGQSSRLLTGIERSSAVGAFQSIANVMLTDPGTLPPPVDQLDGLR